MATVSDGTTAAAPSTSVITLLDLPNEILLGIAARVPYSPDGCSIIAMRLVNRQIRDLLSDAASVKQLRNDIAETQHPIASLFRTSTGDVTWIELNEMVPPTSMVDRIVIQLEDGSKGQADKTAESMQLKSDLVRKGLYLFEAIAHLKLGQPIEVESVVVLHTVNKAVPVSASVVTSCVTLGSGLGVN